MLGRINVLWLCLVCVLSARDARASRPWPTQKNTRALAERVAPPEGYSRVEVEPGSFGAWLRELPVKPGRPEVRLFNGQRKRVQTAHHAVLDIDVGKKDLQQCADAVMRLRAEYLWASEQRDKICFRFTSGHKVAWKDWRAGQRPQIRGNKVRFSKRAKKNGSYQNFQKYMEKIFTYAGTASLEKELASVATGAPIEIGDVFIKGGFPGHAVIVMDVAENAKKQRLFLLAQSYMPAQEIHILRNPASREPWYSLPKGDLETPEWTFAKGSLKRFKAQGCPKIR